MKVTSKTKDGTEFVCYVRKPNAKDNQEAKLYSNALASQILLRKDANGKPNFITRNQVRKLLRDSGRLTEQDEKTIKELSDKIKASEEKLAKGGISKIEGKKIALDLRDMRNALFLLFLNINELDEHTLESEIENANFDYLVSKCTQDAEGKSVFKDVDAYKEIADTEPYAYDAANALKELIYGTTEDMMRDNIENKFLTKYKFVDEKLRLIDSEGHLVDRDGNRINEDGDKVDDNNNVIVVDKLELGEFTEDEQPVESKQEVNNE